MDIHLPALDREQLVFGLHCGQCVLSLLSFSIMASAETSHHGQYHYGYYASLTFFVAVGVTAWIFSLVLIAAKATNLVAADLRRELQLYGFGLMLWLTYTAAVAASATSTDLHATFDPHDGSICRVRRRHLASHGAYFCGRVVSAVVFMYFLCASYAGGLFYVVTTARRHDAADDNFASYRSSTGQNTSSRVAGYDDIEGRTDAQMEITQLKSDF